MHGKEAPPDPNDPAVDCKVDNPSSSSSDESSVPRQEKLTKQSNYRRSINETEKTTALMKKTISNTMIPFVTEAG